MPDEKLRSLDIVERIVEMASNSPKFWRNFNRIVLPAKAFENVLEDLLEEMPVDIRKAQEMLAQRDKLMEEAISRSERIIDEAAGEAERLLDDSEITRKARKISSALREEADRYVLETLEKLEDHMASVLSRIKKAQNELIGEMEHRQKNSGTKAEPRQ